MQNDCCKLLLGHRELRPINEIIQFEPVIEHRAYIVVVEGDDDDSANNVTSPSKKN